MTEAAHVANWIDGEMALAASGRSVPDIDPANGQAIGDVPRSGAVDIDRAVKSALRAQPAWAVTPLADRCRVLHDIADALEHNLSELAEMETHDTGKPIATSRGLDIPRAVRNFRFFADFALAQPEERHDMEQGSNRTHHKPVGVAGLITPWNLPLYLLSWKVAPALAMGNAVVAKPSEMTPQTATALGAIADAAGLPAGLLNIVHGLGPEAGQALVGHPDVSAISFTGGTATGRRVATTAAPMFKKLSLELGGKNPTIVFDDSDLDFAVAGASRAGFTNAGQVCLCGSRILVQDGLYDEFVDRLRDDVAAMTIGDPMDPAVRIGPLVSHAHRDKVAGYVEAARDVGATVTGGNVPDLPAPLDQGAFLAPAVITDVGQDSPCVQEEIFGPVVTVQLFHDEPEAVCLANDVPYGLAATVWGEDDERNQRVAEALDTGMVWINDWLVRDLRVPFGGMKQSGVGREGGHRSLAFFSEARNIYWPAPIG